MIHFPPSLREILLSPRKVPLSFIPFCSLPHSLLFFRSPFLSSLSSRLLYLASRYTRSCIQMVHYRFTLCIYYFYFFFYQHTTPSLPLSLSFPSSLLRCNLPHLPYAHLEHHKRQCQRHEQVDHQRHQIKIHAGSRKAQLVQYTRPSADGKMLQASAHQFVLAEACKWKKGRGGG